MTRYRIPEGDCWQDYAVDCPNCKQPVMNESEHYVGQTMIDPGYYECDPAERLSSEEYVEKHGVICPNCKSQNVEGVGGMDVQDNAITQDIQCNDCEATWTDHFKLVGYEDLQTP